MSLSFALGVSLNQLCYQLISPTRTNQWTIISSFKARGGGDCKAWYVLPKLWLMAKVLCVCKCSQGLRKVITVLSMLVEVWWVEVVSRLRLSSSARQSKHKNHIKAAEPGHSAPVYWFVILLQRLITVGLQRAGWPSARNLKVEVWNSCQAKWKNKQTNQSVHC